jgi:hypothetical protein
MIGRDELSRAPQEVKGSYANRLHIDEWSSFPFGTISGDGHSVTAEEFRSNRVSRGPGFRKRLRRQTFDQPGWMTNNAKCSGLFHVHLPIGVTSNAIVELSSFGSGRFRAPRAAERAACIIGGGSP